MADENESTEELDGLNGDGPVDVCEPIEVSW
jgi:hypothetical protein